MGTRRDTRQRRRLLLLAAVLGLLWTTLVAAGGDTSAEPPPEPSSAEAAAVGEEGAADQLPPSEDAPVEEAEPSGDAPVEAEPLVGEAAGDAPSGETEAAAGEPAEDDPAEESGATQAGPAPEAEPAGDGPAAEDEPSEDSAPPEDEPVAEGPTSEGAPADAAASPDGEQDASTAVEPAPAGQDGPSPAGEQPTDAQPAEPPAGDAAAPEPAPRAVSLPTTLTTRKSTDPTSTGTSFSFAVTGPSFSDSFSLVDGGSHTSTLPGAGSYTLTETVPSGWEIVLIDCTDGSLKQSSTTTSITLSVAVGERWDCHVSDRELATIVIEKTVDLDDDTMFGFTGELGDFTIDPAGVTGSRTFPDLDPGSSFTVTETVPAGWDLTGISCSNKQSSATSSITIDGSPGATITCTFANAAQEGTITVVKEASPADGTDFPFTIEAGRLPESFTLDDDADPALPDRESFDRDPGTWTVAEAPPAGWEVAGISCTNGQTAPAGSTSIDVALGPGGDVTCTFTNQRQPATIVIEKVVDFDDDTAFDFTGDLGDFTIDPDGLSGSQTFTDLDPDADYRVAETVPDGWDVVGVSCTNKQSSATGTITIDPAPGETVTCTFANEAQQGTITVVKVADPVDGTEFSFGGDLGAFTLVAESEPPPPDPGPPERALPRSRHEQTFTVDPGTYDIVEDVPAGWILRSVECVGTEAGGGPGGGRSAHTGVTATVGPGEDVTCTFANVLPGSLTVVKDANPADGTRFPITVSEEQSGRPANVVASFELADGEEEALPGLEPRRYVIAEDAPAGWGLASVDCAEAAVAPGADPGTFVVTLGGGEDVRCTLHNRRTAEITIVKVADVDDGTQFPFGGDLGEFFLTSTPAGGGEEGAAAREEVPPELPPTGEGSLTFTVDPGTYVVTEGELPGWELVDIDCEGGTTTVGDDPGPRASVPPRSVEIVAAPGDVVECTFANRAEDGSLTIRKAADPADGTAFDFTFAPGEGEERFSLRDGEERVFPGLRPATYRVVETAPAGWGVGEIDCGPAEAAVDPPAGTVDVTVGPGAAVTCVFRNTDTATITIVKEAAPADGTDFFFTGDLGDFALDVETVPPPPPGDGEGNGGGTPPQPRQSGEEDLPDRMTFEVPAGVYDVAEEADDAWELVAIVCGPEPPPSGGPPLPDPRASASADVGKRTVTIDIAAGEEIACVFRNRARPVPLTLVKRTEPAADTPFEVQVQGADGTATTLTLRNGEPQTVEVAVGDAVITEQLPEGWGLREAACTGPTTVAPALAQVQVTLRPGTPQTCTLVNAKTALITIVKVAAPLVDTSFAFGGDQGPFTLTVPAPPPPPPPGDDGGAEVERSAARQAAEEGKPGPDEITFEVDPGTYAFTEADTPGWELVAIACAGIPTDPRPPEPPVARAAGGSSAVTDLATRTARLTVKPGDVVECGFENRQTRRGLTIVKDAEPADGTDFSFTIEDGLRPPVAFSLDDDADGTLPDVMSFEVDGKVRVSEDSTPGWVLASLDCDVAGAVVSLEGHVPDPETGGEAGWVEIELPEGGAATCVFTNLRRGSVTVIKQASPADGTDFGFRLEGKGHVEELTLDDGADGDAFGDRATISGLVPGAYSLSELVPEGWALRDVSCAGAEAFTVSGSEVEFELAPGGGVVCTFDDVKLATLEGELFLDLDGDGLRDPGEPDLADVEVRSLWAGFDGEFGTGDEQEFSTLSVAGNSYRFDGLPPGKHRVSATDPDRLEPTKSLAFEIELAPGQAGQGPAFAFAGADLELSVASSTEAPRATQPFTVTINVFNRGPVDAGGVAVRVDASAGLVVGRATGDGTYDAAAGRWEVGGVTVGDTRTLVVTVTPQRAGDVVQLEAEVSASDLADPDSTPNNDDPAEDDQDATRSFTVGVAPGELLPVTGLEAERLVPPALVFLLGGLVLVLAGQGGRRRRETHGARVSARGRHPTPGR